MLELPPLSLYVHIPWCIRKCPYCDFNSHEQKKNKALPEQQYLTALCSDLEEDLDFLKKAGLVLQERPLQSIFIGGGTPSLFAAETYRQLLEFIRKRLKFARGIEITLEANPGTAEAKRFTEYHQVGINRLSLGIQSFNDSQLKTLGRIHSAKEARKAIEITRSSGFDNFNLDLMHGLPNQSTEQAIYDLEMALDYEPSHLSWYELTIEPNTVFYSKPPELPREESIHEMQMAGHSMLATRHLDRYEVSAFALADRQSRHNLNYWLFGDYLGIGAGAHGKFTLPNENKIVRTRKTRQPSQYLSGFNNNFRLSAVRNLLQKRSSAEDIKESQRPLEFLLNALRLRGGFATAQFEARTGIPFSTIAKQVEYLVQQGLLEQHQHHITTTDKGYRLLNSVLEQFI